MSHWGPSAGSSGPSHPSENPGRVCAVVLAGGSAARMDGVDKAAIELGGLTLLERALAATMTAVEVVVVGEQVPTTRPVTWTWEDPRGGGPAAGLLTALSCFYLAPDLLQVLAVDMPHVTPGTFARLRGALEDDSAYDAAVLVDEGGRRQPLCGVYRHAALVGGAPASPEEWHGLPMHRLLEPLRLREVPSYAGEARDVDTWSDLRALREARESPGDPEPRNG